MDVFSLNNSLLAQYTGFARSFTRIRSSEILEKVTDLYAGRRFWPEPMLQLNPHYEGGGSVLSLVGPKGLIDDCAEIFRDSRAAADASDKTLKLRRHQEQAIGLALDGKSFVVTTGTGSGKSLCFFIPIVDAVVKAKRAGEAARTRAVVIYPMNALANSQLEELKKFLADQNHPVPVTFARYTGQENSEERERIKNNPPDILLTNFMMLELLMTRQSDLDRRVVENCSGLRFIVLDELHTYRGRQGADVAMLMRRLRARVGDPQHPPICIGTSATMASEGGEEDRNQVVADVASRLFGTNIGRDAIVTETLRRATDPDRSADRGLSRLSDAVVSAASATPYEGKSNGEIARDDLAIWVETRLGLRDVDQKPRRARSLSLKTAAVLLSGESSEAVETCELALKNALLAFSLPEKLRGYSGGGDEPLFAFKLHQFISGAGRLYTTLDPSGSRTVTFDGQIFDPENPEKRLYSAHFCRRCGQENHPVTLVDDNGVKSFEKREIDDVPLNDDEEPEGIIERWGFLMPEPVDGEFTFQGRDEDYPEAWLEETKSGELRLKATYRKTRAELVSVLPDGTCGIGGQRAWFMPGKFKFCPACGDHHSDSTRDINRLAALSAEGRSSATTIIIAAILRWMSDTENSISATTRKLLAFTDNRQDAALQSQLQGELPGISFSRSEAESPICPICEVPIDRTLAEGCGLSHKLPDLEACVQRWEQRKKSFDDETEKLVGLRSEQTQTLQKLALAKQHADQLGDRVAALEQARDTREGAWYAAQRLADDVERFAELFGAQESATKALREVVSKLETERSLLGVFRDKQARVFGRISEKFDPIVRRLVGVDAKGHVTLSGNGLEPNVNMGGDRSTAAIDSLKVLAFDLAILCLSIEGATRVRGGDSQSTSDD